MIDYERLGQDYEISNYNFSTVSDIGPVKQLRSFVKRKSDGKTIGEVLTYRSYLGRLANILPGGSSSKKDCPSLDKATKNKFNYILHKSLVRNVFLINLKKD